MGSSFSTSSSICSDGTISPNQSIEEYVRLDRDQILGNQLLNYFNCLTKNRSDLTRTEESFIPVAHSSIINTMGKKQCESYLKYNSFTVTDLNIMRSIHKVQHFNAERYSEVKHLIDPLKKAFQTGNLNQVREDIRSMKNIQDYRGNSFTTIDYQLLDILEYMADLCLNNNTTNHNHDNDDALIHWLNIFDILFRGTNIKLSNGIPRLSNGDLNEYRYLERKNTIIFKCHVHGRNTATSFGLQNYIELSACSVTLNNRQISIEQNDANEAIAQSEAIVLNKSILETLWKEYDSCDYTHVNKQELYPIDIHMVGYVGYLYTIKKYKGVFVASQACEDTIFIPQTVDEFQSFLFHDHVLEILCNLKRHYVGITKIVRNASLNRL